jgi:hypothetical protein
VDENDIKFSRAKRKLAQNKLSSKSWIMLMIHEDDGLSYLQVQEQGASNSGEEREDVAG